LEAVDTLRAIYAEALEARLAELRQA